MRHSTSFGTITPQRTLWPIWGPPSHKDITDRTGILPSSNTSRNEESRILSPTVTSHEVEVSSAISLYVAYPIEFSSFSHFTKSLKGPPHILPSYSFSSPSLSLLPYPSSLISFLPLLHPFSSTLIPPPFPPSVTQRHLSTAGLHSTLFTIGSLHLICYPTFPPSPAAWFNLCPLPLLGIVSLMAHRSWVKCPSSSHAPSLFDHRGMSSP